MRRSYICDRDDQRCNNSYDPPAWPPRSGIRRSTPARSCCRSCSGCEPPVLPVRSLVAVGELFGIAPGTMRTALSRMVAAGELSVDDDGYRLVGRLLERKAAQDIGRRPATGDVGRRVVGRRRQRAAALDRRAAGVPHAHGQPAHGRAAARHVDAPGQPRRSRRRRRAGRRARPADRRRPGRRWPPGCGRCRRWRTTAARLAARARPTPRRRWPTGARRRCPATIAAGRRGRALPARRAAAARRADPAAVAARRAAARYRAFDRLVGRALANAVR